MNAFRQISDGMRHQRYHEMPPSVLMRMEAYDGLLLRTGNNSFKLFYGLTIKEIYFLPEESK